VYPLLSRPSCRARRSRPHPGANTTANQGEGRVYGTVYGRKGSMMIEVIKKALNAGSVAQF
jgi:hypothetical protein